jgi:hypothetical protein
MIVVVLTSRRYGVKFVAEYLSGQLEKAGVRVERGKEVDEDFIKNSAPDVVIAATGPQPIVPEYCCSLGRNVLSSFDVLSGGVKRTMSWVWPYLRRGRLGTGPSPYVSAAAPPSRREQDRWLQ